MRPAATERRYYFTGWLWKEEHRGGEVKGGAGSREPAGDRAQKKGKGVLGEGFSPLGEYMERAGYLAVSTGQSAKLNLGREGRGDPNVLC
jgi:hypothetical protein